MTPPPAPSARRPDSQRRISDLGVAEAQFVRLLPGVTGLLEASRGDPHRVRRLASQIRAASRLYGFRSLEAAAAALQQASEWTITHPRLDRTTQFADLMSRLFENCESVVGRDSRSLRVSRAAG